MSKVINEIVVNGETYDVEFKNQVVDGDITAQNGKFISKSTNIDKDTTPESNTWGNSRIDIQDTNSNRLAYIQPMQMATGETDLHIVRDGSNNPNGKVLINDIDIEQINADLSAKVYEPIVLNGENGVGYLYQYRIGNLVHCVSVPSALIYAINTSANIFNGLAYKPKLDTKIEVVANDGTSYYAWVTVSGKVTNSDGVYPTGKYYYFDFSYITED